MAEYIEKEHLLDFLDAVIEAEKEINSRLTAKAIQCSINVMPSKDVVERKRGKWIGGNGVDYVRCSCCHKNYDWVGQAQYYNYCPNCGADMRGREDEHTD